MATRDLMKNNLTFLEFDSYLSEKEPFKSYSMDHTDLKRLQDGHVGGQVRERADAETYHLPYDGKNHCKSCLKFVFNQIR